jgi:hypothetical protein
LPGKRIDELPCGANSSLKASVFPLSTILSRFPPASDPNITLSGAGHSIIQVHSTQHEQPWSNALKIRYVTAQLKEDRKRMRQPGFTWGEP